MSDTYRPTFWQRVRRQPLRQAARLASFQAGWLRPQRLADERRLRAALRADSSVVPAPGCLRPPPHHYQGYRGPWLEDAFFRHWLRASPRSSVAYLPVFWTDLYLQAQSQRFTPRQYQRFQAVVDDLLARLAAEERCYFTVLEYDHMIWNWHKFPQNVAVFSAGGWGDIPVPLLKGSPPFTCPPKDIFLSFIDRIDGASNATGVRGRMVAALREHAYFGSGPDWRQLMARSTFSLCPRGLGRASFRLYEALSVGSIPIYLWDDAEWLPYRDEIDWSEIALSLPIAEVGRLPQLLKEYSPQRIAQMQGRIAALYADYFTLAGACRQIERQVERLGDVRRFGALIRRRPYPPGTGSIVPIPAFLRQ